MPKRVVVAVIPAFVLSCAALAQHSMPATAPSSGWVKKMTDAEKLKTAASAAPPAISRNATIMDWPADDKGQPRQLRAGTNGWVCFPTSAAGFGPASREDPMCLDKQWQAWAEAWNAKAVPKVTGTGIAYMLRGDKGASNTDPFATGPTADNQWVVSPPHIMVLYDAPNLLDAFPTDPRSGGPWVMWKGTPYAHLMVPVSTRQAATMPPLRRTRRQP